MLEAMRKRVNEKDRGFTLIELIVVVVIIGILSAIAIPAFLSQRERAYDSTAQSDLRNAAIAFETAYAAELRYPTDNSNMDGFRPSDKITMYAYTSTSTGAKAGYVLVAKHDSSDNTYLLSSYNGSTPEKQGSGGISLGGAKPTPATVKEAGKATGTLGEGWEPGEGD